MNKFVLALGFFDSLHMGHRYIIDRGISLSKEVSADFRIATFDDCIYDTLNKPEKELYLLSERRELMENIGVTPLILPTDSDFLGKSPADFLDFIWKLAPAGLVFGKDYRFGKNAAGDSNILHSYFSKKNIPVIICDLMESDGKKVSTTEIKRLLSSGNIEKANSFLVTPYFMKGKVVEGLKNGRKFGLPTANITFDRHKFIPLNGVYMSKTYVDGKKFLSVSNVGSHPTLNYECANLETNILDFDGDIYGKEIKVELHKYVRPVKKFSSSDELIKQIKEDINKTREELKL